MSGFLHQLVRCSLSMALVTALYLALAKLLRHRYAPRSFDIIGRLLLIGYLFPMRPSVSVSVPTMAGDTALAAGPMVVQEAQAGVTAATNGVQAMPSAASGIPLARILFAVWLVGMLLALVLQCMRHIRFLRAARRWSGEVIDPQVLALFHAVKDSLGIKGRVRLQWCACISTPMITGLLRPTILLPEEPLHAEALRQILTHELTHYRRCDLWHKAALMLASAIHWFNPAIHCLAQSATLLCEIACDEAAVRGQDEEGRHRYAMAILSVAGRPSRPCTPLSTSFNGGKQNMKQRIASIMEMKNRRVGVLMLAVFLGLTVLAGTAVAVTAPTTTEVAVSNPQEAETAEDKTSRYAPYEAYGLTYDARTDTLRYQGALVRYFEDMYPIGEEGYAGIDFLNEAGTVDVYAVRDTANIRTNADGSYDPKGMLTDVLPFDDAAFQARDIEAIKAPQGASAVSVGYEAGGDASASSSQETHAISEGGNPEELAAFYAEYAPFGLTFSMEEERLYFDGMLVRHFEDIVQTSPSTYERFTMSTHDDGEVDVHAVHNDRHEVIGIAPFTQAEFDARTRQMNGE